MPCEKRPESFLRCGRSLWNEAGCSNTLIECNIGMGHYQPIVLVFRLLGTWIRTSEEFTKLDSVPSYVFSRLVLALIRGGIDHSHSPLPKRQSQLFYLERPKLAFER